MKILKMFGYLNLLSNCLHNNHLCRAEKKIFDFFFFQKKSYSYQSLTTSVNHFNFPIKMEGYPAWGYEKAPEHDSYNVIERRYNKNFDFVYTAYEHKLTKMQILAVGSHDPLDVEQAFVFYVKTLPHSDEGIPHILEHAVLNSSKKYKNPFKTLMKGSLYTLLNAYTYNDRTVFLARSMNNRDFLNILDVYADCVFQPSVLKEKTIFQSEGWSYLLEPLKEEEKLDDSIPKISDYKISYNGIVYNEMKGIFSNPIYLLIYETSKILFPENIYSKVSGGYPRAIPELTYESFKQFYIKNYNPQKIKLLISSNRNCKEVLDFMDSYLKEIDLSKYDKDTTVENVKLQKYINGPIYEQKKYASNSPQKESLVLVAWLINPIKRNENDPDLRLDLPLDFFVLSIVSYLLVQTPTSVLYKALIESGLGTGVLTDLLDDELAQNAFTVGLKGIPQKSNETDGSNSITGKVHYAVEKVIMDALKKEVEKGFNKEAVEAAINYIEFRLKEANLKSSKSTYFILEIASKLNYNRDPLENFNYDVYLSKIKQNFQNIPNYFENFVKKHLINNNHRSVVLLEGDDLIGKEIAKEEQSSLKKRIDSLSENEKENIITEFNNLKKAHVDDETSENNGQIPTLSITDLNKKTLEIPVTFYFTNSEKENDLEEYEKTKSIAELANNNMNFFKEKYIGSNETVNVTPEGVNERDIPMLIHEVETDGIVYIQLKFSLDEFTLEELYYINLFKTLILENRTSKRSEEEFILLKEKEIGRLEASVHTYNRLNHLKILNKYNAHALFNFEIHVLNHKCNEALKIAMEALAESDLSNSKKVIEILNRFINNYRTAFVDDADYILTNHISAHFSSKYYLKNIMSGFANYKKILEVLEIAKKDYSVVENVLKGIRNKLLNSNSLIVNVTTNKKSLEYLFENSRVAFKNFLSHFKNNPSAIKTSKWNEEIKNQNLLGRTEKKDLFVLPTLVNYVGMAGSLFKENEYLNPSFMVVIAALQNTFLWDTVREKNGAYGVSASLNYSGVVYFSSYRDPNLEKTLETYRQTIKGIRELADKMTEKDLLRYIIFIIRKIDKPRRGVELGNESFGRIFVNETEEDREEYRQSIMKTSKKDFYDFANLLEKYLNELEKNIVVITNAEHAERFVKENKDFNRIPLE